MKMTNSIAKRYRKDVAEILGYSNTRDAIARHVDDEDKADVVFHDGSQNRKFSAINESGLYSLILSSKLPTAKHKNRTPKKFFLKSLDILKNIQYNIVTEQKLYRFLSIMIIPDILSINIGIFYG